MGDRARLGHVDRVARGLQPGRDDVAELDEHADIAGVGDLVDPVVVPIGDQEPAAVGLQRVLDSGRDVDRNSRRIAQGERADVRDHGEAVGAVDSVDADDVAAADVGSDSSDQCVRRPADERYVGGAADADDRLRQTAGKGRDLTGPRIDARDPAGGAFGDVERATGADRAARATLEAGQQLGGSGRRGARCGGRDHRDHGRYQDEQLALGDDSRAGPCRQRESGIGIWFSGPRDKG